MNLILNNMSIKEFIEKQNFEQQDQIINIYYYPICNINKNIYDVSNIKKNPGKIINSNKFIEYGINNIFVRKNKNNNSVKTYKKQNYVIKPKDIDEGLVILEILTICNPLEFPYLCRYPITNDIIINMYDKQDMYSCQHVNSEEKVYYYTKTLNNNNVQKEFDKFINFIKNMK